MVARESDRPTARKPLVLCVDDDPAVLASLRRCLRNEPYDVIAVEKADEALKIMNQRRVSLLLTDQRMPGLSGTELFDEARRRSPATRRIMLTAYAGSPRVSHGLGHEIEYLISKPWNDEALRLTLRELLSQEPPPSSMSSAVAPLKRLFEREEAKEELREMNLILQNALEGISRLDARGRILKVNKSFSTLLGFSPGDLAGRGWSDSFHPDDLPKLQAAYERMRGGGKSEVEARGLRRDGSSFPAQLLMIRAADRDGTFIGHYGFLRDITERKRAEAERDVMSAQLLQGQKLQAIGQLAAGIAHEINNPVGFMLSNLASLIEYGHDVRRLLEAAFGLADRAASGKDARQEAEEFNRIRRTVEADFIAGDLEPALVQSRQGAERIRDIVKSLREFTHADEGDLKPVNLAECMDGALRLCWNEIKYKATVERDFSETPPVRGTALQLEQVFMNLLVNAAQAIDKKGEIRVSIRREGDLAVVRVRDTGCGIPPENLKRLFEPFFSTKPVGKGTGLGLHVAYKIVKAHHGQIDVSSEVGRGTEFVVRLPLLNPKAGGA